MLAPKTFWKKQHHFMCAAFTMHIFYAKMYIMIAKEG